MKNFDWSRFRNYGLWVSVFALIPLLLNAFGVHIIPDDYQEIVNAILAILVGLGLINNPTTKCKWFGDDGCTPAIEDKTNEDNKEETK